MTFISQALDGKIYIAEPSRKGSQKLLWSVMPEQGDPSNPEASGGKRTEPHKVPLMIRRQAYRRFYNIRRAACGFGRPPKMTAHQRQEALTRLARGETQADVARSYNVGATTIGRLQAAA